MAKIWKHSSDSHERFLLGRSFNDYGADAGVVPDQLPDLAEEDVWSAMTSSGDANGDDGGWTDQGRSSQSRSSRARRWIMREDRHVVGGLSLAFEGAGSGSPPRVVHQFHGMDSHSSTHRDRHPPLPASAPVNVPDWPSILRAEPAEEAPSASTTWEWTDEEDRWMPPHEYIQAREHAASGGRSVKTPSVLEGAGRTLKGRDMSRVRDAVWLQTGFFG